MSDFLPITYEIPEATGNYLKFKDGVNRIRILTSPIIGWLTWTNTDNGRRPLRNPMSKPFMADQVEDGDPSKIKHFWAMVVWNYNESKLQILEITQKGIQKSIKALTKDEDWGSPLNYDLTITKSGELLNTEYEVQPKPAKSLDPKIEEEFKAAHIDLNLLYSGGDPFAFKNVSEDIDPDSIPL